MNKPLQTTMLSHLGRFAPLLVAVVSVLLYVNTLGHGFVLDDEIVVSGNSLVKQGVAGLDEIFSRDSFYGFFNTEGKSNLVSGGRYRPLTIAVFALVYELTGPNPLPFHVLCVAAYAAVALAVYYALLLLFGGTSVGRLAALIGSLFFAAHPLHTEVVANIKSLDEVAALLFALVSMIATLRYHDGKQRYHWGLAMVSMLCASLAKENAVTFVAIIPVAMVVFRGQSWRSAMLATIPAAVAAATYLAIRTAVVGWTVGETSLEFMNNPFLTFAGGTWTPMDAGQKALLLLATFGEYARLLVLPHPLTHDYYPRHIEAHGIADPLVLAGLIVTVAAAVFSLRGVVRRSPWSVGAVATLASFSVVSNVVFPIGTLMGERFLFMPTFGIALIVGVAALTLLSGNSRMLFGATATAVLAVFAMLTITRNPAWASNNTLFFTDIAVSKTSAKLNNACGGELLTEALRSTQADSMAVLAARAIGYLDKAIAIHPTYAVARYNRAICHIMVDDYPSAIRDARSALNLYTNRQQAATVLARALRLYGRQLGERENRIADAINALTESWSLNSSDAETAHLLGVAYAMQGTMADAVAWFERAVALAPGNTVYRSNLDRAYKQFPGLAPGAQR